MKQPTRPQIKEVYNITDVKPIYTLIVDGNSLFKRSISVDKRLSSNGIEYGAIFQFLLQVKMMLAKKDFDYVYVFWDGDKSGYLRYKIYSDYKRNRDKNYENYGESDYAKQLRAYEQKILNYAAKKKVQDDKQSQKEIDDANFKRQRDILCEMLEELFIRQVMCDMVEGDDLIAYYVNNKLPEEKIVIMTGDLDIVQLVSKDVAIYALNLKPKIFLTPDNVSNHIGYNHENIALIKTICGDGSDNISPVLGYGGSGHKTLFKFFPELVNEKKTLDYVLDSAKKQINERIEKKEKPYKALENLVNSVTKGVQGNKILEINERLVDLSKPFLTEEAVSDLDDVRYTPIDPEGRSFTNLKRIINDNHMNDLLDDNTFSNFFSIYNRIITIEKKRFENSVRN